MMYEGWVYAALCNWANRNGGAQIAHHTTAERSWIEIIVNGDKRAVVTVEEAKG